MYGRMEWRVYNKELEMKMVYKHINGIAEWRREFG